MFVCVCCGDVFIDELEDPEYEWDEENVDMFLCDSCIAELVEPFVLDPFDHLQQIDEYTLEDIMMNDVN